MASDLQDLAPLETLLGHHFADNTLLELALTHRSVAHERAQQEATTNTTQSDNEQLEFLGDAVAGLLVADELYRRFPALNEGALTRMRAFLVSRRHLAQVATTLQLGSHLRLGRGEEQTGGRNKPALLANAIEAVLAAVYIDAGLEAARSIINQHVVLPALDRLTATGSTSYTADDHKTALQQRMQAAGFGMPQYVVIQESGPDHRKHFTVEVRMATNTLDGDTVLGQASANSKKEAQQAAARVALERIDTITSPDNTQEPA